MSAILADADQQDAVSSYRDLRRGIGILGLALPFVLVIGYAGFRDSISGFYYTDMRNWFVGSMSATGVFLIFYRYGRVDTLITSAAGVLAVGVALFPTTPPVPDPAPHSVVIGDFHLAFAGVFLLLLAYMCAFRFTLTSPDPAASPTARKLIRNRIYLGSGAAIAAAVVGAGLFDLLTSMSLRHRYHPVFWFESIAVIAFGVAWLVKGETLFRDRPGEPPLR